MKWCQTCGQEYDGQGEECDVCSGGRATFRKAIAEGRVSFKAPKNPQVGDEVEIVFTCQVCGHKYVGNQCLNCIG